MLLSQAIISIRNTNAQRCTFQENSKKNDRWDILALPPQPVLTRNSLEAAYYYMSSYVSECQNKQTVVIKKPNVLFDNLSAFQRLFPRTRIEMKLFLCFVLYFVKS